MPTYRGVAIFGEAVSMTTTQNPTAEQENAFFGITGVESLFGGGRGRITLVKGLLRYPDASSLGAAERLFASLDDGLVGALVDMYGFSWPQVKLSRFVPSGMVRSDPVRGYARPYQAEFKHLI